MKKIITIAAAAALMTSCLAACGTKAEDKTEKNKRISVVTTIFPEYDWVREIVGDSANADITLLLDGGVDLHSYNPSAQDIMKISSCDVFVYVGGQSDRWVDEALKTRVNKDMKVVNLLDVLGDDVKTEEIKEGMKAEEAEPEKDEHIWLSLKNTKKIVSAIADTLSQVDSENASIYKRNAETYRAKLESLNTKYEQAAVDAKNKVLLFGDRFPFRYMTDDYGLDYYAAFPGCEAETEASFETIVFLSNKVNELGLDSIMAIEGSDHSIAETIKNNTATKDQEIVEMDSMQSVKSADINNGVTYLSIMEKNLDALKRALK